MKLTNDLMPILKKLQSEGHTVYGYESNMRKEHFCLFWFENGRVLNIQPSDSYVVWGYRIGVSYIPSRENGSGCDLSGYEGVRPEYLLTFRNAQTWVRGAKNYKSMTHFLEKNTILKWFPFDENGELDKKQ